MSRLVKQLLIAIAATASSRAMAQTTQPSFASPMLQQLNAESQSLFDSVRPGLVRVQLPSPRLLAQLGGELDSALDKYNLDPALRDKLRSERTRAAIGGQVNAIVAPPTQPSDETSSRPPMMMVQRPDGGFEFVAPSLAAAGSNYDSVVGALVAPRLLGVVYDDAGHIVIPVYIDPQSLDESRTLLVSGFHAEGASRAAFVGSDRQTNLSVLKLDNTIGKAARFAGARPVDGSLVMMLAAGGESGRLAVWTRGQQERGVVITVDGNIAGFARIGQFLDAQNARPIVDQLIEHGKVRRATLGVMVTEAESPDGRRAMHVEQVKPGSAAESAGLRENDYILSVAGAPVDDLSNFAAAISAKDGDTIMQIWRDGKAVEVTVPLRVE